MIRTVEELELVFISPRIFARDARQQFQTVSAAGHYSTAQS